MVFDSLKKVFKFNSKSRSEEIEKRRVNTLNEEIDEYEKEIQEYLSYSSSRNQEPAPQPPAPSMPENLAQSGAIATAPPAATTPAPQATQAAAPAVTPAQQVTAQEAIPQPQPKAKTTEEQG